MDRLIDAARLSQILDVPVTRIWKAAREGHLPCFKIGNKYRFDEEAVLKHLSFGKEDPFTAETWVA
jgi:excisionase family DNA binding protein